MTYAVVTTFPNNCWQVYAEKFVRSFVENWPEDVPLLVQLDDDLLFSDISKLLRPSDAVAVGWSPDHAAFVARNKEKDDPNNYRKQTTRFCHKVFSIYRAYEAAKKQIAIGGEGTPRYLMWLDADVVTSRKVTIDDIKKCLPKEGDAVSYLGRKDWPHSECGFLAFDLQNGGNDFIEAWYALYVSDQVTKLPETHDSWAFDAVRKSNGAPSCTNLTDGKPGMDIWQHSPLNDFSIHYKGPAAKEQLFTQKTKPMTNIQIQTKNAIPDEKIREHIEKNQKLIKNWVKQCLPTDEQIVVVSAGPQMYAEDVLEDYKAGKKIVAVKHALDRLKAADIKPWACILLDPRDHVINFVEEPDKDVIWFVASQVDPKVTEKLLLRGCNVWGYHAAVGAGEGELTAKQYQSIISGGSATATRGLYLLKHLGFTKIKLYGYDLCFPDKVDLNALDNLGQPKYLEVSIGWQNPMSNVKKVFYTEPQLLAQFEELNQIINNNIFDLEAVGDGIVPFILKAKKIGDLRQSKLRGKIDQPTTYQEMLKWKNRKLNLMTTLKNLLTRK